MNTMLLQIAKSMSLRMLKWTAICAVTLSAFAALHFDMYLYGAVCAVLVGVTAATKVVE